MSALIDHACSVISDGVAVIDPARTVRVMASPVITDDGQHKNQHWS
jgi:hypothetical protein